MNHRIIAPLLLLIGCASVPEKKLPANKALPNSTGVVLACMADLNRNGSLEIGDISVLSSQLGTSCESKPNGTACSDFNLDGIVNLIDISSFASAYNSGSVISQAICSDPSLGDNDGLSVWFERTTPHLTDPDNPDSDGDGTDDLHEQDAYLSPCKVASWDMAGHFYKATLAWDPPLTDIDGVPITNIAGYRVFSGQSSGNYVAQSDVTGLTFTKNNLSQASTTHFAIATLRLWPDHPHVEGPKSEDHCIIAP